MGISQVTSTMRVGMTSASFLVTWVIVKTAHFPKDGVRRCLHSIVSPPNRAEISTAHAPSRFGSGLSGWCAADLKVTIPAV